MPSATLRGGFYRILLLRAKKLKNKNCKSEIHRVNIRRALKRRELIEAKKKICKIKKNCKLHIKQKIKIMETEIKLIRYKDYRGKSMYYLQLRNNNGEHSINIGMTTFEKLCKLIKQFTDINEKGVTIIEL